jgi:hypothetical protein
MPWFLVDDNLSSHPKARAAGLPAMGLWVVAGAYASQYLTEGFVPEWFVVSWPQGKKHAQALVNARLWDETSGGWQFHQWQERQRTKEQVETDRAATRERQKRWRDRKRDTSVTNAVSNAVTDGVTNAAQARPGHIEEPKGSSSRPRKRGTRLPDDWHPTDETRNWTLQRIDQTTATLELEKFRNYWTAKSSRDATKLDWDATWRNWVLNSNTRSPPNGSRSTTDTKVANTLALAARLDARKELNG